MGPHPLAVSFFALSIGRLRGLHGQQGFTKGPPFLFLFLFCCSQMTAKKTILLGFARRTSPRYFDLLFLFRLTHPRGNLCSFIQPFYFHSVYGFPPPLYVCVFFKRTSPKNFSCPGNASSPQPSADFICPFDYFFFFSALKQFLGPFPLPLSKPKVKEGKEVISFHLRVVRDLHL